ncbi:hypothetical protein F4818DRAFT_454381 [Hypoxylon cercidicola]|nr:hypothetical protein F4818DRAFT_454381 [Hypoxylon cercidicola]
MEAVAAVGLASNVLQFFEFTTKLVRISNELRNDAASSENQDHQVIATHLEGLAQGIKDSAQAISQTSATASPEEKALQAVVERCSGLSKDLLDRLKKCGIQPGQNASRLRRTRVAFKAIWNKKEIEGISNRLQLLRSDIILHYTVQIKKTQLDQQTRQSTTDDIQAIQSSIDALGQLIDGLKHDIEGAANNRRSEIINSITETRTENSQLHAQASQQTLANRLVLSEKLDGIHSSMTAMNITLENIQSRQSESFESISQVKVENSAFLASVTQQVPLGSDSSASFQNVIRPLFEEYIEKALAEMKKEYRITARSEADHLLNDLLPTLHEMQSFCTVTQGNPIGITDEDTTEAYHESSKSQVHLGEIRNAEPLAPHQLDKTNVSVIYRNRWRRKTGLGVFSVIMRDRVHFDPSGRVTKLYELTAQFNPSPRWFATGCSITYKYKSDARGSPEFGLKPKSYRVLEDGHVAFKAIMSGDISTLQSMLAQRFISPSDTNKNGQSLLSMAVLNGELDICKALVQSGADINAYDM